MERKATTFFEIFDELISMNSKFYESSFVMTDNERWKERRRLFFEILGELISMISKFYESSFVMADNERWKER